MANQTPRRRRLNRIGLIIAGVLAALILSGILYIVILINSDRPQKVDDERARSAAASTRRDMFKAPADDPIKPPEEDRPPKREDKPPQSIGETAKRPEPAMSIEERERRLAATSAWKSYFKRTLDVEEAEYKSRLAGIDSLWTDNAAGGDRAAGGVQGATAASTPGPASLIAAGGPAGRFAGSDDKVAWANRSGGPDANYVRSIRTPMLSDYQVMEGTPIKITLQDGIISGLPIGITAFTVGDVHCAVPGGMSAEVCIPMATKIILSYNTRYTQGECRAQVAAERMIFEDNSSMSLDNMPVSDSVGYAGLKDECDTHLGARLLNAVLFSAIDGAFSMGEAALGAEQVSGRQVQSVAQEEARDGMRVPPTIRIKPGYFAIIKPHKDILFEGPYEPMVGDVR